MSLAAALLVYLAAGATAGFIAGFLGVGGGIIYVPVLSHLFRLEGVGGNDIFHLALGTSLAAIILTATSSARTHHASRMVDWRAVGWTGAGGVIGATLAAQIALRIEGAWLQTMFGAMLIGVALHLGLTKSTPHVKGSERRSRLLLASLGIVAGFFSGFFGVGGGIVNVPLFILFANFAPHRAVGTSSALVVVYAIAAAANYVAATPPAAIPGAVGFVYLPAWIALAPASIGMAHLGATAARRVNPRPLKQFFALLLFVIGLRDVLQPFWGNA
ncbi:sulfite exporter TauE/SafE family protein [bacterium]|nr:sulfite exporter TauE/SafE family protein [bacterium]